MFALHLYEKFYFRSFSVLLPLQVLTETRTPQKRILMKRLTPFESHGII